MTGSKIKYLFLLTFSVPTLAIAGDSGIITKGRLDSFYELSIAQQLAGEQHAVAFAGKHIHKEYEGVMHISSTVNDAPPIKETLTLTKPEYLSNTRKSYEVSKIESAESEIISYEIAGNGRSAKVKDRSQTLASIPVKTAEGKPQVYHSRQYINCENLFVLSEDDVIQLKSSTCEIEGKINSAN